MYVWIIMIYSITFYTKEHYYNFAKLSYVEKQRPFNTNVSVYLGTKIGKGLL